MISNNRSILKADSGLIPIGNYKLVIPKRTTKLLYFSNKKPPSTSSILGVSISVNLFNNQIEINNFPSNEPSTIYMKLPIGKPDNIKNIPHPDYYPTYAGLNPKQRWIYLNWLQNPSESINIGYVFLYYYGLERQLLLGKFDLAFDEILYLRKYYHNSSFVFYSNQALLGSCILKNRPDRLRDVSQLLESSKLENIYLLAAYYSGLDLTADSLINISKNFGINQRYINRDPDLFKFILNDYLTKKYGGNYFPFSSRYKIADLPKYPDIFFANISFPPQI